MQPYIPEQILIEESVAELPLAKRVQECFPSVPRQWIADYRLHKEPSPITASKRCLVVAEQRGEALKSFPKIEHAINLGDFVFNPVSNCHLECTYCILQSYLQNNPNLTLFANLDHFGAAIRSRVAAEPARTFRLGTGELSDSLALDGLTRNSREFVPLFASLPNAFLELKTKSDTVENLLDLDHRGHTVVSWSISPSEVARTEELKCASTAERLAAARRVQEAGYPVGLHLDPMIAFEGWEAAYRTLIEQIVRELDPRRIAWISLGTLRFDKGLKAIATERFAHSDIFAADFVHGPDGKWRYFKSIRLEIYRQLWRDLADWSSEFTRYLCMEPPWMWESVTGKSAPSPEQVEEKLVGRLHELQ